MRQKLVVGNWKLNGSLAFNQKLIQQLLATQDNISTKAICAILPPAVYLPQVSELLKDSAIACGAQNLSEHDTGAYTGEISGPMLKEFNCQYVLVGHCERRNIYKESGLVVAKKFVAAIRAGITPILCVGESLAEREADKTLSVIKSQLGAVLEQVANPADLNGSIMAYEPVWAIGTGKTATPEEAQAVHVEIRKFLSKFDEPMAENLSILYGGSVTPSNAKALFSMPDIDGGLIGGASLKAKDFLTIYTAARGLES